MTKYQRLLEELQAMRSTLAGNTSHAPRCPYTETVGGYVLRCVAPVRGEHLHTLMPDLEDNEPEHKETPQ
jgi:hypothetical protein